jgi:hypothetical protein
LRRTHFSEAETISPASDTGLFPADTKVNVSEKTAGNAPAAFS